MGWQKMHQMHDRNAISGCLHTVAYQMPLTVHEGSASVAPGPP
jgi:hypothetical protein